MDLWNDEYAVYLPAVNDIYASEVAKQLSPKRPFPAGLTLKDLIFWEPNQLWTYPYFLHSIGLYAVGALPDNAVTQRQRENSTMLGDSGGFQIGKGSLKGLKALGEKPMPSFDAIRGWQESEKVRDWILTWLVTHADYAMTIDMPLWAAAPTGSRSPFHNCSVEQLIDMTVENLRFIDRNTYGSTKWLNVVQGGVTEGDIEQWWLAVKWFRRGGWAMAGRAGFRGGLFHMLSTLLMMRDDGAFEPGQDWIHVLGVSTAKWAVLLTAIQKALRRINPTLTISFDSSSPFQTGGRYENAVMAPTFTSQPNSWSMGTVRAPQSILNVTKSNVLAFQNSDSPLAKLVTLDHLSVRGGIWDPRAFDSVSNALLVNHNVWVYLDAFRQANDYASTSDTDRVPKLYLDCIALIADLFADESWRSSINHHRALLDQVEPNGYAML
ncbi:MAG: hypothetical protein CVU22_07030 [Betaproteobacteria bacterium HGW-Betaproteobacteria-16]|nr:MAG: hypothetical protein CVU22_07030 [Betaproteobacteria bacterium HGW-Betaproteobacteria-16]